MKNTNWRLINENILNVSRVLNNLLDSVNELDIEWLVRNTNGTVTNVKIPNLAKSISIVRNDLQDYIDIHVYTKEQADSRFVNVTGDTMSGPLTLTTGVDNQTVITSNELKLYSKRSDDNNRRYAWLNAYDDGSGLELLLRENNNNSSAILNRLTMRDNGDSFLNGNIIWHAGNDGINSALDAGYLAGKRGNEYSLLNKSYCYGAYATYSNNDQRTVRWDEDTRSVVLESGTDENIGMAFPVFKVKAGEVYSIQITAKSNVNSDDGVYFRMLEKYTYLPDDKFVISDSDDTPHAVKYDRLINFKNNGDIKNKWVTYRYTYVPGNDAVIANLLILNWSGLGTNKLYIREPKIQITKVQNSDRLDNLDSTSYLKNNDTSTGSFSTTDTIQAGRGSGGVALTVNDGYGNANVTFNHKDGVPEQDGNAGRISVNTDDTNNVNMVFQLAENVAKGVKRSIGNTLSLSKTLATFFIDVKVPKITFDTLETKIGTTAYQYTDLDDYLDLRMGSTSTAKGVRYRDYDETIIELNRHTASKYIRGVDVKELGFITSNTKKISKQFILDGYFTKDEYLEIATIAPTANSRDFNLIGTVNLITAYLSDRIDFVWGVRSDTLPEVITKLEYNAGNGYILYSLVDTDNGIAKLYIRKTVDNNTNSVMAEMHLLQRVDDGGCDFSDNTEKDALPTGFTVTNEIGFLSKYGNYNIEGRLRVTNGIVLENSALISNSSGGWTDLSSTNIDHLWHNDGNNSWNFVSDGTYKQKGNSILAAGGLALTGENSSSNTTKGGYTIAAIGRNWFQTNESTPNASYYANYIDYNVSGSEDLTADRNHVALSIDVDSSATGGDTSNEHRLFGISLNCKVTGDSDNNTGIYTAADGEPSEGQISEQRGVYCLSVSKGNVINSYGALGYSYTDNGGTLTTSYGALFRSYTTNDGGDIKSAIGVRAEVEHNNTDSKITTASAVQAIIDNNVDGDDIGTGYLIYGNYEGSLPSTAWGVYINTNVKNYFRGDIWTDGEIRTDVITTKSGNPVIINVGESKGKAGNQTSEHLHVNAEGGIIVNTPDAGHSNWQSGYTVKTSLLTGYSLTTNRVNVGKGVDGGIRFPDDAYGGSGDTASITLENPNGGEATELTIAVTNDEADMINLKTPSKNGLLHNGNKIWTSGNDGAGSGLDADTVDGIGSDGFVKNIYLTTGSDTKYVYVGKINKDEDDQGARLTFQIHNNDVRSDWNTTCDHTITVQQRYTDNIWINDYRIGDFDNGAHVGYVQISELSFQVFLIIPPYSNISISGSNGFNSEFGNFDEGTTLPAGLVHSTWPVIVHTVSTQVTWNSDRNYLKYYNPQIKHKGYYLSNPDAGVVRLYNSNDDLVLEVTDSTNDEWKHIYVEDSIAGNIKFEYLGVRDDDVVAYITFLPKAYKTNGYRKIGGGLIEQYGYNAAGTVTFPITFPNRCLNVTIGPVVSGNDESMGVHSLTNTNFSLSSEQNGRYAYWRAIGY